MTQCYNLFTSDSMLSCSLVADVVLFNSYFNMTSFLETIDSYLNFIPDHKPQGISEQLRPKCSVLYFPLQLPFPLKHGEGETHLHSKLEVASEIQDTIFETENITALGSPSVQHKNEQCDASATIYTRNNDTDRLGSSQKSDSLQVVETVLNFCGVDTSISKQRTSPLHIVWPHRWWDFLC